MRENIAIIGGSGVYQLFEDAELITVKTPFGKVKNISKLIQEEREVYFLPRHGTKHSVPPHLINYRANISALFKLGVKRIFATNAVGSLVPSIKPGEFVIPDQIIDMTKNRKLTFFDGFTELEFEDGSRRKGVVHLDYTEPYCPALRKILDKIVEDRGETVHSKGTHVCSEGPRFETPAEIKMYQKLGGTIVGMTTIPEAILAREVRICYATLCLVTNFGAGMQEKITHSEVIELFNEKIETIRKIVKDIIMINIFPEKCDCQKV
ncbi:MAG: S-methyl-5'-thioadenosine phosphorylase [Candidatus Heimdallarchaeaceae archaeon]